MGLSCFRAISGWDGSGSGIGLDLCAGLFYEHRFAMLIKRQQELKCDIISTYIFTYLAPNIESLHNKQ